MGVDFRALMVLSVVVVGALAAGMIGVTRRLRGATSLTDAFFPLALLHWGHAANLLWGWPIQFFASVAAWAWVGLLAIAQSGALLPARAARAVVGLCALLLPLCGANGLVLVPPLAVWIAYSARTARGGADRPDGTTGSWRAWPSRLCCWSGSTSSAGKASPGIRRAGAWRRR